MSFETDEQAIATAPAAASPTDEMTIAEACASISRTDRRIELIAAFAHSERVANRHKDSLSAFEARFAAFGNTPA
jgi:hypothetical protein